jgi:hypothetical protein
MAASKTELPVIDDQGIYLFIGTRAGMRVDRHPHRQAGMTRVTSVAY